MKYLITGGCGFIGHHLCEHILKTSNDEIIILDKLTYASNGFDRLRDINIFDDKRVRVLTADFCNPLTKGIDYEIGQVDFIVHLGAETHVDNSIVDPEPFVRSNVLGTMNVLNFALKQKDLKWFVYFGTDEVFGPAPAGVEYKEWDRFNSGNPYAATKAGGEELSLSYANTYKLPLFVIHCMNAFGERQHFEKFIPSTIRRVLQGETVVIHANRDMTQAGSRYYVHARNISSAVTFLLGKAEQREKYNICGEREADNLALAMKIADVVGKPLNFTMTDFHSCRPGHDLRYALNGDKLKDLGYEHPKTFDESLEKTIRWYLKPENKRWLGV